MKKYERILIILVVAWFIGNVSSPLMISSVSQAISTPSTGAPKAYYNVLSLFWGCMHLLPQILIAIWMFIDAKNKNLNKWSWGLVGLGLGINGAILYITLQILEFIRQIRGHPIGKGSVLNGA